MINKIVVTGTITPVHAIRKMKIKLPWWVKHRFNILKHMHDTKCNLNMRVGKKAKMRRNSKYFMKNDFNRIGKGKNGRLNNKFR